MPRGGKKKKNNNNNFFLHICIQLFPDPAVKNYGVTLIQKCVNKIPHEDFALVDPHLHRHWGSSPIFK